MAAAIVVAATVLQPVPKPAEQPAQGAERAQNQAAYDAGC